MNAIHVKISTDLFQVYIVAEMSVEVFTQQQCVYIVV